MLIVRFSSIGDIVLTTPVLKGIREQLPNVEVHYLTKRPFFQLLDLNPNIDKIHLIESSIDEVIPALKEEGYDHIIDLHHNVRTKALKMKLGIKMTSFPKLNLQKWLLVNLKWNKMPKVHIVDRYFDAVKELGVKNRSYPIEFFIRKENNVDIQSRFGLEPGSYISVAIGAQFATKRMPEELLFRMLNEIDDPVVIVGGKEDEEAAKKLADRLDKQNVISAAGHFNIGQSASIVQQSSKVLTNDTGMMHIAAAFELPIISVWGNTVPEFGMFPYRPSKKDSYTIHEVKGLNCRPCSKIGFDKCPKGHFKCMLDQDARAITSELKS